MKTKKTYRSKTQMKRVTKNNLLLFIEWKKEYINSEKKDTTLLTKINNYIVNVINKDDKYYRKLYDFDFTDKELKYLM
jgi:hypothetical protein